MAANSGLVGLIVHAVDGPPRRVWHHQGSVWSEAVERDRDQKGQGGMVSGLHSLQLEEDVQALGQRQTEALRCLTFLFLFLFKQSPFTPRFIGI